MNKFCTVAAVLLAAVSCKESTELIPATNYEIVIDGKQVSMYTLKNADLTMQVTNFGARVVSIWAPDRNGKLADVATGYGTVDEYVHNAGERFLGAAIGPVGNRIAKGRFRIDSTEVQLPLNNNGNTLHGGLLGFDMLVWDVVSVCDTAIVFGLEHSEGIDNWPSTVNVRMTYALTSKNQFKIDYEAVTDKPTPLNLTNHTFFNLTGVSNKPILDHVIRISASQVTEIDSLLIPTGRLLPVEGTPFDLRSAKRIGESIDDPDVQLQYGPGYDHNWCLDRETENAVELAAEVYEPESGRVLRVYTDQPGLQFYAGNFFDGKVCDKFGNPISWRCSFALETQKWPDSINHENFPPCVLRPGETYTHTCIYEFDKR